MLTNTQSNTSKELYATISSKGQITVPVEVRRYLKVLPKDKIAFIIDESGEVKLTQAAYPDINSLKGVAGSLKYNMDWKEVKQIAYEDRLNK